MITGCGEKLTTCSRRSISGRTRSMNGVMIVEPGLERAVVAAEALEHRGARLRDDADRPRRDDQRDDDEHGDDDQCDHVELLAKA